MASQFQNNIRRTIGSLVSAVAVIAIGGTARAEEPAREFLDGLRARGLHDVAIDYLDQMSTSPLAPAEIRETVLYEKALTFIAAARTQRDPQKNERFLNDARRLLESFVTEYPDHEKANAAQSQLGSLIFERARAKVASAKSNNSKQQLTQARKLYEEAFAVFGKLQLSVASELDQIPKVLDTRDRKQAQLATRRTRLRADNLQTELLAAAAREEMADTFPAGSTEEAKYLTEAASLYDGIYKNYRSRLAGFYARMYQGRCNQRMGKLRDALGYYGELLDQPNASDGMFKLKTETLRLAMECWLAPSERKYIETIKRGSQWLDLAPPNQDRQPDWLAIRLSLAKALKMQADAAKNETPPDTKLFRQSIAEAVGHAKFVAGESGPLQEPARELVTALGGIADIDEKLEPTTFTQAQLVAKEALDAIQPTSQTVATLTAKIASEQDQAAVAALKEQLEAAQQDHLTARQDALRYYKLALQLVDESTPQSDVNLVRYFLCYLYYLGKDYREAALVGDFVCMRFPDSAGARQCAQISLACYLLLFTTAEESDRRFETRRLFRIANHIADRWPGTPDAANSLFTVIPHFVNAGNWQDAHSLTRRIPESSPHRQAAEFITGQSIWASAVQQSTQIKQWELDGSADGIDLPKQRALLQSTQQTARETLEAGYRRLPSQPAVTASNATAMLSLAQVAHAELDDEFAIEVLEHDVIGPLVLVENGSSEVQSPVFIEATYRTALEAYVALLSSGDDEILAKAKSAMTGLQASVGSDTAAQQRMLAVYVNLARSVEEQMKSAPPASRATMAEAFESFLGQLSEGSSDVGTLNWVAETFAAIATGFEGNGIEGPTTSSDPSAKRYYEEANKAFVNLLQLPNVPPKTRTQIRVRQAAVLTKSGQYEAALKILEEVLAENPKAINVQVETARLLQIWGKRDPGIYNQAISGIGAPNSNAWGWGKIATATQPHKLFRETFYEARYELARCQLELALTKAAADKEKLLAAAYRTATQTKKLYPTLGGVGWTNKYNELINRILVAQGKQPTEPINIAAPN